MTDWVDNTLDAHTEKTDLEDKRKRTIYTMGPRYWEALRSCLHHDARKLNARAWPLKGAIEIKKRDLIPSDSELNINKLALPAIRLTLQLNLGAETIKIVQTRKETPEGNYHDSTEVLQLTVVNDNEIAFVDPSGKTLDVQGASYYILSRLIDPEGRSQGFFVRHFTIPE